jgi:hypothetical protein
MVSDRGGVCLVWGWVGVGGQNRLHTSSDKYNLLRVELGSND